MIEMQTKAQQKATDKYNVNNYDRICIRSKKGTADRWKSAADAAGKSLTQFIVDAVEKEIENECL